MQTSPITKYQPFQQIDLPNRQWPSRVIDRAPVWCSVDLRDGNQALPTPMSVAEKLEMFELLVKIGFKQIEVGFPSASQIEFDFMRRLIEEDRIPDDVTIQTLVQSRPDLIERTFESLRGARNAIVHLYNSTSPTQRRITFRLDKPEVVALAEQGTAQIKELAVKAEAEGTKITLQYSPESFSQTEMDFAVRICEAVTAIWNPSAESKIILNLPATVEAATPNVHADQIEYFCGTFSRRDQALISLHTHNDRGTGVAATELGLMAGADRVEGTLFGNGERTGNVDIVTVALNMYTQGIQTGLDFGSINTIREIYERTTRMDVHERHPYAGDLVFTAFSGSHQDAIKKGMDVQSELAEDALWEVPYLPVDPKDIGRNYRAIIRINAQSGKGGVAYVMETQFGYQMPKKMHREIGRIVNDVADQRGIELTPDVVFEVFQKEYLDRTRPLELVATKVIPNGEVNLEATISIDGTPKSIKGTGNGPIDAFVQALRSAGYPLDIVFYTEHSLGQGAEARAVSYVEINTPEVHCIYGAGVDTNIEKASFKAIISALNRVAAR